MGAGKTLAWLNLAYRFGTHVLTRMPRRMFGSDDAQRFRDAVQPEGYVPLEPAERAMVPRSMRCVHCGLCALASPAAAEPYSAWDEAWTFVGGPSRSVDRAPLVAAGSLAAPAAEESAAVCPLGVPIMHMTAMHVRLATSASLAELSTS